MAVPTVRGVGAAGAATTAISPGLPTGTVAGDLLIMFLETSGQAITVSGWTQAPSSPQSSGGARLTVFYKIAVGSDATTTSDSGNHQHGYIVGVQTGTFDSANPFNTSGGGTQATTTAVSIPGSTTTVSDCLVITANAGDLPDGASATEFSGWTNADLSFIQELIDSCTAQGDGGALGVASWSKASAGSYTATTATAVTTAVRGCISLAIAPPVVNLTGTLFSNVPTFFTGTVTTGAVNLAGTLFANATSFFVGTVTAAVTLNGVLFVNASTFPTGIVTSGPVNLAGVLFNNASTFPTGTVVAGAVAIEGVLFENPPVFNSGTVTASYELTGVLFENPPTFGAGAVTANYELAGVLFDNPPIFESGTVVTGYVIAGVLFENLPVFPQGAITGGALVLAGVLFVNDPMFLQGVIVGFDRVYPFWPTATDDAWLAATDDGWPVGSEIEWQGV